MPTDSGSMKIPVSEPAPQPLSAPRVYTGDDYARFYTDFYRNEDDDSPSECRAAMIEQVAPILYSLPPLVS